jgi:hypothetical protein
MTSGIGGESLCTNASNDSASGASTTIASGIESSCPISSTIDDAVPDLLDRFGERLGNLVQHVDIRIDDWHGQLLH